MADHQPQGQHNLQRNSQYCLLGSQFPVRSKLCATYVLPIVYLLPSSQCVPDCIPFPIFPYCSQYVSSVFPVFSDCSLCSECVTCGRPPAVGPTLPTQKQSVLFTQFPVPSVVPIVSGVPSIFSSFPGVLSVLLTCVFPIVYFVPSFQCVPHVVRFSIFPYCSQYVSSVSPL